MKRFFLPVLIAFFSASRLVSVAQPTITAANSNLRLGDQFVVQQTTVGAPEFVTAAQAGASQTWNFASLASNAPLAAAVLPRASAPKSGSYVAANMVIKVGNEYSYVENNGVLLKEHAAFDQAQNISLENTDPAEKLKFPLTFNTTFTDNFTGTVDLGGSTIPRNGTVTVTAEGYGTLITPTGTYQNVLKLKTEEIANPLTLFSENTVTYDWLMEGTRFPLLRLTRRTTLPSTIYSGFFLDRVLGQPEEMAAQMQLQVFPNPANRVTNIRFYSNETAATVTIRNLVGQEIKRIALPNTSRGNQNYQVDVSGLPSGIYLVQLETAGKTAVQRLVIQ